MSSDFRQIYDNSIKKPEDFWKEISEDIFWFKKPTQILNDLGEYKSQDPSFNIEQVHFFPLGGIKKAAEWAKEYSN